MKHIGLFEGIGGFSLAARWMDWETIAWCEWNPFCQKVLGYHFPKAKQHGDITTTDFSVYRGQCDVLTGGFPCQPYSVAGKRKGKEDERHLWPEMLRAIREVQPRWVVGENVLGLVNWSGGLVFHEVQTDLEAAGYEVWPYVLPACAKNAPHRRDRIWFVAHAGCEFVNRREINRPRKSIEYRADIGREEKADKFAGCNQEGDATYSDCAGLQAAWPEQQAAGVAGSGIRRVTSNTSGKRLQGRKDFRTVGGIGENGEKQPDGLFPSTWEGFPTQSPLCARNDGLSYGLDTSAISFGKWRAESIKASGNAVVPNIPFEIFKAIEQYEQQLF